jgi:hypothetical protein
LLTDFDERYLSVYLLAAGDIDRQHLPFNLKAIDVFEIISSVVKRYRHLERNVY